MQHLVLAVLILACIGINHLRSPIVLLALPGLFGQCHRPCRNRAFFHRHHPAYGHRRLAIHLGIHHKRAQRVMTKFDLRPPPAMGQMLQHGRHTASPILQPGAKFDDHPLAPGVRQ